MRAEAIVINPTVSKVQWIPRDHAFGSGTVLAAQEERGQERGDGDAEAHGHLLHRARDAAPGAGVGVGKVGEDERVHAGVLHRGDEAEGEAKDDDEATRGFPWPPS